MMKPVNFYRTLAVLYAGAVFALSLMPAPQGPSYGWDKVHHFIAYAIMSFLFMRAAVNSSRPFAMTAVGVFLAVFFFGIGVEFFQSLTPTRHADARDALANGLGSAFGIAAFKLLKIRAGVKRCS